MVTAQVCVLKERLFWGRSFLFDTQAGIGYTEDREFMEGILHMLKYVIFDFGGVMYRYEPDYLLSCFYDNAEDLAAAKPVIYREWHKLDEGSVDYEEYVAETEKLLPERLRKAAREYLYGWHLCEPPMEQTWALAARLKARGYGIYLLSNAPVTFAAALDIYPILKIFDGLVVSAPIQMVKPNADIFQYTLDKYGLKAEECVFLDDTEKNIKAARDVGMHGIVFQNKAQAVEELCKIGVDA